MSIVVQKFGGTSVATDESRIKVIDKIMGSKKRGNNVAVVVSAMGRKGSPYATDTLIQLAPHLKGREMDLLMSCGEIISACVLADMLQQEGYQAVVLTGAQAGIITSDDFLEASILRVTPQRIVDLLSNGYIPVITGFQGISEVGNITTLGRGGSDTSASIIGEAIKADRIEIYTDVDGIMTADPRIFPEAKVIKDLSYSEVFQMADSGAKVIHPRAVEVARRAGIPLHIKNTFNNEIGTVIMHCPKYEGLVLEGATSKVITSIAYKANRVQFILEQTPLEDANLFPMLASKGVSLDIINIFPKEKVFTVDVEQKDKVIEVLDEANITFSFIEGCCKLTLIGERMTGVPGVMAKIITALQLADIQLLQTADSLTTIACLIYTKDLEKAVDVLHKMFDI